MPKRSPISAKKRETAFYRSASEEFKALALDNQFVANDFSRIKKQKNRTAWTGYCCVGSLLILKNKDTGKYHITIGKGTTRHEYADTIADRRKFCRERGEIWDAYVLNKLTFESFNAQSVFEDIMEGN